MIVGDQSVFAIDWHVMGTSGTFTFANFRFWVMGEPVGNYETSSVFGAIRGFFREFVEQSAERRLPELEGLSKEAVFDYIHEQRVLPPPLGSSEDIDAPDDFDYELASKLINLFHLDDVGECSFRDSLHILLINDYKIGAQRLIWREREDYILKEAPLPFFLFDNVVREFLDKSQ